MVAEEVGVLSDAELAKIAKDEVNEDPERLAEDLQAVKDWLEKQPHLQNVRKDDRFIQFFLRGCKYSIERTKEKLDCFYSVRSALPEWFDDWDKIDDVLDLIKSGAFLLLKGYDKKGRRVMLFTMEKVDPTKVKYDDLNKCYFMIMEILIDQLDQCSVAGFITASNVEGATMAHVGLFSNPVQSKKAVTVFQEAYPIRPKAMHMMNLPSIMETVLNLFRSFMNDKMKARMQVGGLSNLQADAGTDVLPEELGGNNGKLQDHIEYSLDLINEKKDWLKAQCEFKSDETKRSGKPKDYSEIFGMEGSFRKLNVD